MDKQLGGNDLPDAWLAAAVDHLGEHLVSFDEVAHASYHTPSKVIAGIEQLIVKRTQDARASRDTVVQVAEQALHRNRRAVEQSHIEIRAGALLAGATLTGAAAARAAGDLQIEFRDGRLPARVRTEEGTGKR